MMTNLEITNFLNTFFNLLTSTQIDVSNLYLDHFAYQTNSASDYEKIKFEVLSIADEVSEKIIGDRRVSIFKLRTPFDYKGRVIPVIEIIEPKEGQICPSAFEHAEFVVDSIPKFVQKYPDLDWDLSSANRPDFPHLKLKLSDAIQVKFHPQSILEIIEIEKSHTNAD